MSHDILPQDDANDPTVPACAHGAPRLRKPERHQGEMRWESLDYLLPPDHQARIVWDYVERLDLTPLLVTIRAVDGRAGRDANDPRLLVALWLFATIDGVGSARELDRLCQEHLGYRWICGGVSMNQHTLSDFRTEHTAFLNELLTKSVATLLHHGLVDLKRVAQDGMRVRASAGSDSFRRVRTLKEHLRQARQQMQALEKQLDEDDGAVSRRQEAARVRAAHERVQRLQQAVKNYDQLVCLRSKQQQEKGTKFQREQLRTSTTDPEARRMQMPDGGTRPGYNVQLATAVQGGVIVGVEVTNSGGDGGQLAPMVEQIARRHGQAPEEILVDGGFATIKDINAVHGAYHTSVYAPIKDEEAKKGRGTDPYQPRPQDGAGVAAWRQRMGTEEAKRIYRLRAQTAEWVNAGMRQRGMYQFAVRGQQKVLAVALWYALAHNLLRSYVLQTVAATRKAP